MPARVAGSAEADLASGAIPKAAPGEPAEVGKLFQQQLDHLDQAASTHIAAPVEGQWPGDGLYEEQILIRDGGQ